LILFLVSGPSCYR